MPKAKRTTVQPATFDELWTYIRDQKVFCIFYAIIDGRGRKCVVTTADWGPTGRFISFYYETGLFGRHQYNSVLLEASHHPTVFIHKRDFKAYVAEINRNDDQLRQAVNAMTYPWV